MRRLALACACVLALSTPGAALRAQDNSSPEVRGLVLRGVEHVDVNDLTKSISTRPSRCRSLLIQVFCWISHSPTFWDQHYLDHDEMHRDVLRTRLYYWKRGWRDARVDTSVTPLGPRRVKVTFDVTEGPPTLVRRIAMTYDSTLISDRTRNRLTMLHARDPLDLVRLDSMRVLFQNAMWDQGYGDAAVDTLVTVDDSARLADVELRFTPNHRTIVGRIDISGTKRIDPATIRHSITFAPGDVFRLSDLLASQRNLYESNLFRLAAIQVLPQPDSVKNVDIAVTEAPLHEVRVGPGLNNVDFFQFQTHYTAYNFLGAARRLDVDGTVGNLLARSLQGRGIFRDVAADVPDSNVAPYLQPTYAASVDFKQPAFLQRPADAAGFGAFTHRSINPGVFVELGYGGQATFTHEVAIRAPASLNYRYELNRVDASDTFFCVNYGVCDTLTIHTLRLHHSLSPATITGFIDRSDLPFSPTTGYVARFDFEHASRLTFSDYRYNRVFVDAAIYGHQSGTHRVYSAHLRAGWVRPMSSGPEAGVLHPRKRFYAGGANSVRGYAENELGPRILAIDDSTLVKGAKSVGGGTCGLTVETIKSCDPNTSALASGDFLPQPLGGTSLLEGSVEYRFPLPLGPRFPHWVGAVFVDGGIVGSANIRGLQSLGSIIRGTGAVTPGIGIRYMLPVGPVRVDLGFNPDRAESLAVVTAVRDSAGVSRIVPLAIRRNYVQGRTLLDHISLHFSIGEAY